MGEMAVREEKEQDPRIPRIVSCIRVVPDFPKKGIMFQDITTLLLDPKAFKDTVDLFVERYTGRDICVVAVDQQRAASSEQRAADDALPRSWFLFCMPNLCWFVEVESGLLLLTLTLLLGPHFDVNGYDCEPTAFAESSMLEIAALGCGEYNCYSHLLSSDNKTLLILD
ncbi:uncharacterized protein LOC121992891 isoform X2 [Zingiber officinale]|uniref:uncharacterized protein LOC121992891 isoform X2 n=1 Tax=Zingiber officinale TaxID=94328 RepID=UPI001C4C96B8|nr:uncharacterized protein LOC121992891 isoform X2 [Zingiber officinale]